MRRITITLAAIGAFFAAAAVALRRLFRSREDRDWTEVSGPGRTLTVDGVRLHYIEKAPPIGGDAPAIVMLHGFGGNTFSFRYQMADLAQDYRCVAIDLKGFGYSERVDGGDYSLTEQARLMFAAMDQLGIEKASIIGHSLGGAVVLRMAAMYPDRVKHLVLAASVSGDKPVLGPRLGIFRPFMAPMAKLVAIASWRRLFYDTSRLDMETIRKAYITPARIRGSSNTVWEMWRDVRHDPQIPFRKITQPVLILWAECERIIPMPGRSLAFLQKHLPQARTIHIPRSGHMLLEEQPEACNAAIRSFMETGTVQESAQVVEEQVA
ncbi:MAG TPA: alpha/beta hydrolase [Dehalococcoidia bacterium]|nr:alpha/beta hydrolase [Dehalococcoidia bacterium]